VADVLAGDYYCKGADGDIYPPYSYCDECSLWPGYPAAWVAPQGPPGFQYRALRGGAFTEPAEKCRVSARGGGEAQFGYYNRGFRCCGGDIP
jgi:formylglycine-generating enzyme required for sulfatase activity